MYERFNKDTTFKDGRYEVKLLWKECHATLPGNYTLCQRRLKSLMRDFNQKKSRRSTMLPFKISLTRESLRRWKAAKHLTVGQEKRIISHITLSSVETRRQRNSGWCMMHQLRQMETRLKTIVFTLDQASFLVLPMC